MKFLLSTLILFSSALISRADMLELKSGELVRGAYQGGTAGTIRFESNGTIDVYPITSVLALTIIRSDSAPTPSQQVHATPTAPAAPQGVSVGSTTQHNHVVPSGSELIVKLRSEISTVSARPGQKFDAILETDLRAGLVIVAPRGSVVRGTVTEVRKPRRIVKTAALRFTLDDIIVGNRTIRIQTNTQSTETHPDGSIIRGAAKGAIVGEIVDNDSGKGAEVGASLAALKKGDHIVYSAGSLVTFNLTRNLRVTN